MFRYGHEDANLFVEEGTDRVPDDGCFHIVLRGVIVESHPTAKKALGRLGHYRFSALTGDEDPPGHDTRSRMLQAGIVGRFMGEATQAHYDRSSKKGGKGR